MLNIFPSKLYILAEQYLYYSFNTKCNWHNLFIATCDHIAMTSCEWRFCVQKKQFFFFRKLLQTDHKHNHINILDFITLITTLLYNTNINSFGAPVKILQQLQKCQVENADLLRVAHIYIYMWNTVVVCKIKMHNFFPTEYY